jgi:hypothetical protein
MGRRVRRAGGRPAAALGAGAVGRIGPIARGLSYFHTPRADGAQTERVTFRSIHAPLIRIRPIYSPRPHPTRAQRAHLTADRTAFPASPAFAGTKPAPRSLPSTSPAPDRLCYFELAILSVIHAPGYLKAQALEPSLASPSFTLSPRLVRRERCVKLPHLATACLASAHAALRRASTAGNRVFHTRRDLRTEEVGNRWGLHATATASPAASKT